MCVCFFFGLCRERERERERDKKSDEKEDSVIVLQRSRFEPHSIDRCMDTKQSQIKQKLFSFLL